jgi:NTP pyrophosphatase (non-canonical NTP hydrolase)
MDLTELQQLVNIEHNRLLKQYSNVPNQGLTILARMAKLNEEIGELADQILGSLGLQRPEKLYQYTPESLRKELADVVITAFVLAKGCNVDMLQAINEKIQIVTQRKINREINPII